MISAANAYDCGAVNVATHSRLCIDRESSRLSALFIASGSSLLAHHHHHPAHRRRRQVDQTRRINSARRLTPRYK